LPSMGNLPRGPRQKQYADGGSYVKLMFGSPFAFCPVAEILQVPPRGVPPL